MQQIRRPFWGWLSCLTLGVLSCLPCISIAAELLHVGELFGAAWVRHEASVAQHEQEVSNEQVTANFVASGQHWVMAQVHEYQPYPAKMLC